MGYILITNEHGIDLSSKQGLNYPTANELDKCNVCTRVIKNIMYMDKLNLMCMDY